MTAQLKPQGITDGRLKYNTGGKISGSTFANLVSRDSRTGMRFDIALATM
ncbi:hypothetical protein K492DRAFT_200578 [Lichtheimia hyalospora FSU 10163]|nr:hypothetical protein K492DRAFT_200578 [Lichtheimia hyalospora FSU 10163]